MEIVIGSYNPPVISAVWTTSRIGKPSTLLIKFVKAGFEACEGMPVQLSDEGKIVFFGYVFRIESEDLTQTVLCYDQIRYLMFKDTYLFEAKTADQITALVSKDMGLKLGALDSTGFAMDLALENKKLIDIIENSLQITCDNTGVRYTLWDDAGAISLSDSWKLDSGLLLDGSSLVTGYSFERSIDDDTYNRIKLAQKDKKKGLRTVTVASGDTSQYGTLQLYKRVDEKLSKGEIDAMAHSLLAQKNRVTDRLTIKAIGDTRARAGWSAQCELPEISGICRIEKAVHTFANTQHTMQLELWEEE